MLRPIALTLLLAGLLSHPLALLCLDECTMPKGSGDAAATPVPVILQADMRECCLGSARITKQWNGKPQPKVKRLDAPPPLAVELFATGFSHLPHFATPVEQRGSPPTASALQVLRI